MYVIFKIIFSISIHLFLSIMFVSFVYHNLNIPYIRILLSYRNIERKLFRVWLLWIFLVSPLICIFGIVYCLWMSDWSGLNLAGIMGVGVRKIGGVGLGVRFRISLLFRSILKFFRSLPLGRFIIGVVHSIVTVTVIVTGTMNC